MFRKTPKPVTTILEPSTSSKDSTAGTPQKRVNHSQESSRLWHKVGMGFLEVNNSANSASNSLSPSENPSSSSTTNSMSKSKSRFSSTPNLSEYKPKTFKSGLRIFRSRPKEDKHKSSSSTAKTPNRPTKASHLINQNSPPEPQAIIYSHHHHHRPLSDCVLESPSKSKIAVTEVRSSTLVTLSTTTTNNNNAQNHSREFDVRQKSASLQQLSTSSKAADSSALLVGGQSNESPESNWSLSSTNEIQRPRSPLPIASKSHQNHPYSPHFIPHFSYPIDPSSSSPTLSLPPPLPIQSSINLYEGSRGPPVLSMPIECLVAAHRLETATRILLLNAPTEFWRMDLHHLVPLNRSRSLYTRLIPDCRDEILDRIHRFHTLMERLQGIMTVPLSIIKRGGGGNSSTLGSGDFFQSQGTSSNLRWQPLKQMNDVVASSAIRILDELVNNSLNLMELTYHVIYELAHDDPTWKPASKGLMDRKTLLFAADDIDMACLRLKLAMQQSISDSYSRFSDQILSSSCNLLRQSHAYMIMFCRTLRYQMATSSDIQSGSPLHSPRDARLSTTTTTTTSTNNNTSSEFPNGDADIQLLEHNVNAIKTLTHCVLLAVQAYRQGANKPRMLNSLPPSSSSTTTSTTVRTLLHRERVFSQMSALHACVESLVDMLTNDSIFVGNPAGSLPLACKPVWNGLSGSCLNVMSTCINFLEYLSELQSSLSSVEFLSELRCYHHRYLCLSGAHPTPPSLHSHPWPDPQPLWNAVQTALQQFEDNVNRFLSSSVPLPTTDNLITSTSALSSKGGGGGTGGVGVMLTTLSAQ